MQSTLKKTLTIGDTTFPYSPSISTGDSRLGQFGHFFAQFLSSINAGAAPTFLIFHGVAQFTRTTTKLAVRRLQTNNLRLPILFGRDSKCKRGEEKAWSTGRQEREACAHTSRARRRYWRRRAGSTASSAQQTGQPQRVSSSHTINHLSGHRGSRLGRCSTRPAARPARGRERVEAHRRGLQLKPYKKF